MTHRIPIAGLAGSLLLAGCGARGEPSPGAPPPIETAYLAPPDTLVLVAPGGATVWLRPSASYHEPSATLASGTPRRFAARTAPGVTHRGKARTFKTCFPDAVCTS